MNPPFTRLHEWVAKAEAEAARGVDTLAVVPRASQGTPEASQNSVSGTSYRCVWGTLWITCVDE